MARRDDLEKYLAIQQKIQYVTRYEGWRLIEDYIKGRIREAEEAFHKTTIENLTSEQIVRKTISQRTAVNTLKDVLRFVYDNEAVKQAEKELEKIHAVEKEEEE